jgi:hypothetical protein
MIGPCAGRCNAVFPTSKIDFSLRQSFASQKFLLVFLSKSPLFTPLSKLFLILF